MEPLSFSQFAFIVAASIVIMDIIRRFIKGKLERKALPLPPGPIPIPLLGNALSINREEPWKTYTEWQAIYGDIFYHRLLDQDIVVLGSESVAVELLEKRSKIYSDRPFVATLEPYGLDSMFVFTPYGEHWRSCRRMFRQTYGTDAALNLYPMQIRKARQLVIDMIDNPSRYEHNYTVFSVAIPLAASYGYETIPRNDPIVCAFENFAAAAVPAATLNKAVLLKLFPFLLRIPNWLPGSSLKREAKRTREEALRLTEMPYKCAEEFLRTSNKHSMSTMVSNHLNRITDHTDHEQWAKYIFDIKKAGVTSISAGSDTVLSALMVFTLAIVSNPRVLKRAQAEIDSVVGTDRLPDYSDRHALPYVNAIIRETLRWHPVTPLGVWHATTTCDVYNGQYIPNGTTVIANIWAMSRNEAKFPNPEEFIPERFIDDEGMLKGDDPSNFVFGFGRRVCPGRHTADASLFAAIATMLATLDFSLLRDERGTFQVKWINGITHRPRSFPCRISPRAHVDKSFVDCIRAELMQERV